MARFKVFQIVGFGLLFLFLASLPAHAQRGGHVGGGMHFGGYHGGFGGYHGGSGYYHGGYGYYHGGYGYYHGYPYRGSLYFGYGYPFYGLYGSFGYNYWPYYWYPPAYSYYYPPSQPMVIYLRPNAPADGTAEQQPPPQQQSAPQQQGAMERYWLILLKDGTVLAATDYWLEGSMFHYITRQGKESSVEYSRVDVDFTRRLNKERGMEFPQPRVKSSYQPMRYDAFGRSYTVASRAVPSSPTASTASAP